MQPRSVDDVLDDLRDELMGISGVVGVGVGVGECDGRPCIRVFVSRKTEALVAKIPAAVDGYEVAIEETGEFNALGPSFA